MQGVRHADHCTTNDIRGRALYRRIDGGALKKSAHRRVLGIDFRIMDAAAENRFDVALLVRPPLGRFHIVANPRKTPEVGGDVVSGLALRNAELRGEAE